MSTRYTTPLLAFTVAACSAENRASVWDSDAGNSNSNGSCAPITCASQGKNCGTIADGCGSTLDCGMCSAPDACGGGGTANLCGRGTCTPASCAAQHKNCGNVSDGCSATLACGACTSPQTCGGGGPNVCATSPGDSGAVVADGGGPANIPVDGGAIDVTAGGLLPPDNATIWQPGLTTKGGIPNRTTVCATIQASAFGNGTKDASSAVQAALDACPVGQVVKLSAGTFQVNSFLNITKGITLRGSGAGVTFLQKTNGAKPLLQVPPDAQPLVVIGPNRWPHPDMTSHDLTSDGAKGSYSISVSSSSGLSAGQFVLLDELSGAKWMPDPLGRGQVWAAPDWRVVWSLHNPGTGGDDPLNPTTPTSGGAASWFSRQDRVTAEVKEIASVSGNVVTFTSPLHISYRASHMAQVTGYSNSPTVSNAGIENLTATGYSDGCIRFEAAAYSWAKNVEVTVWTGEGVAIDNSFRIELRDSFIHDAAWSEPGGAGYAISLANGSAEALIENNISMMANKVMVARCSGAGSVFGYNYADDGFIETAETWIEIGVNGSHMVGPHHILFEGNYGFNWDSDKTHGSSIFHTVFRNWLRGVRRPFVNPSTGHAINDSAASGGGPQRCIGAEAYSYWMSFLGNVLGTSGQMGSFTYDVTGKLGLDTHAIWLLGWDDVSPQPYDPKVAATAVREGNWDWVQSRQSWSKAPATALPNSLYLSSKPAFFGSNPWPWVDPTTGATYILPAKARFDANTPNAVP